MKLIHNGPKSLVWAGAECVWKVYRAGGPRPLSAIAQSYESAHRENPDLFPPARVVGFGRVLANSLEMLCIEQARVAQPQPSYDFSPHEWDDILIRWDRLIARHAQPIPSELRVLCERLLYTGDQAAYDRIAELYFDSLAAVQAPLALRLLRERSIVCNAPDLPYPKLSVLSKIVGDISPKHVLLGGPWLAYDLEKYGVGDPAKDLSTILRFYLYRRDPQNAERVFAYLRRRYDDADLLYRVYLAALGSGSRLLGKNSNKIVRERYHLVLDFYPIARRYLS
ncbi:MAG: hypothetical protein N3E42_00685 [Candidatus Bipolaricaulota bacterium]|nr:hypothetical protein [Candidatus Bipolaricaulota bacterium]